MFLRRRRPRPRRHAASGAGAINIALFRICFSWVGVVHQVARTGTRAPCTKLMHRRDMPQATCLRHAVSLDGSPGADSFGAAFSVFCFLISESRIWLYCSFNCRGISRFVTNISLSALRVDTACVTYTHVTHVTRDDPQLKRGTFVPPPALGVMTLTRSTRARAVLLLSDCHPQGSAGIAHAAGAALRT